MAVRGTVQIVPDRSSISMAPPDCYLTGELFVRQVEGGYALQSKRANAFTSGFSIAQKNSRVDFRRLLMRILSLSLLILFLPGCGGEVATEESQTDGGAANSGTEESTAEALNPEREASAAAETPPVEQKKLPFDMPIMPGARYLSGMDFSKPSKRRGPEAIATIIAQGTTLEVIAFYEKALTENGFTPTVGKHNDESTATVRGVRENGDTFSVTSMRKGSKAADGECQTGIVATKPKPEQSE